MKTVVGKAREILFNPGHFFSRLKPEGIGKPFVFLLWIALFYSILWVVASLIISTSLSSLNASLFTGILLPAMLLSGIGMIILYGVLYFGSALIGSFIGAAILYVWLLIWRVNADYERSYQLYVYGNSPMYIFGWIPFVNFFIWIWSMVLLIIGTMKMYNVNKTKAVLIYLIPVIIILSLAALILFMLFSFVALSNLPVQQP